ncbi:MAG: hypothetical protein R3C05_09935 [Pirellulaceae bacterium]
MAVKVWDAWSGDRDALTIDGVLAHDDALPTQEHDYLSPFDDEVRG